MRMLHRNESAYAQERTLCGFKSSYACDGFSVETGEAALGGKLKIETAGLSAEIRRREAVREQKKRAQFNP